MTYIGIPVKPYKGGIMDKLEWIDIFGDNLREIMFERRYSQERLAKETGISQSTISDYLNKKYVPSATAILNIAYVLDCPMEELVDFGDIVI